MLSNLLNEYEKRYKVFLEVQDARNDIYSLSAPNDLDIENVNETKALSDMVVNRANDLVLGICDDIYEYLMSLSDEEKERLFGENITIAQDMMNSVFGLYEVTMEDCFRGGEKFDNYENFMVEIRKGNLREH